MRFGPPLNISLTKPLGRVWIAKLILVQGLKVDYDVPDLHDPILMGLLNSVNSRKVVVFGKYDISTSQRIEVAQNAVFHEVGLVRSERA